MARDVSFFDRLGSLLAQEREAEKARMTSLAQGLTLREREEQGLSVLDLETVEEEVGLGGRILLTLARADRGKLPTRVSNGDLVAVLPRRAEVKDPAKALVSRATSTRIQLAFDREPPAYLSEGLLRLDVVPNDVTYERVRAGLQRVKAMDKGQERHKREVLLGNEPPRFDNAKDFTPTRPLNPEQQDAAKRALAAEDFFLVHGPPGTGKSTVLAEVAAQAVARGERLLCTAASNAAVDHLLELCLEQGLRAIRVGHPARVAARLQEHTLDIVVEEHPDRVVSRDLFDEAFDLFGYARRQRSQGRSRERFSNARSSTAEAKDLMDEARKLEKKAVKAVLARADVVCVTLASLGSGVLAGEEFDRALLDEATQATEPLALLGFLRAPKVVLAGDPQQLPPTVLSQEAAKAGLGTSLFERLLKDHGDDVKRMLREQYRMNAAIMAFPSKEMYGGELRAHPSVADRTLSGVLDSGSGAEVDAPPVLYLDTAGKGFDEEVEPTTHSLLNPGEATYVIARVRELLERGLSPREIAVIAPYSAQARHLREALEAVHPEVEVDTVDAFQGREKDAVLVSMTRSNSEGQLGFLNDLRRMNVALTRARRHLFVVGDSATLSSHPFYARFIEGTQTDGGYRSAWEWPDPTGQ
ncbi:MULTISPECIES: AAA domain-containing protein [unclassified Corallococcus]|uniref:AAA domain-containing protein n=1 Tax=unclassified Corallococcus TaxID=2685029 RepID=UPI001A8F5927|nr:MULTISPECIES: AAA domain-containing protein [unclassified Corallococcus]MBN9682913.1 AAA family ATPase [Corallococcus sp. NCSPR001]WAS85552.1 AAA domain-containing protein [Corallococcus sp. NCRR]